MREAVGSILIQHHVCPTKNLPGGVAATGHVIRLNLYEKNRKKTVKNRKK